MNGCVHHIYFIVDIVRAENRDQTAERACVACVFECNMCMMYCGSMPRTGPSSSRIMHMRRDAITQQLGMIMCLRSSCCVVLCVFVCVIVHAAYFIIEWSIFMWYTMKWFSIHDIGTMYECIRSYGSCWSDCIVVGKRLKIWSRQFKLIQTMKSMMQCRTMQYDIKHANPSSQLER